MKIFPVGARIFVDVINPVSDVEVRAKAAGLTLVQEAINQPKPTTGRIIALGNDPLVQDLLRIGDIVSFSRYAGEEVIIEGSTFRCLELREVTTVMREDFSTKPSSSEPSPSSVS